MKKSVTCDVVEWKNVIISKRRRSRSISRNYHRLVSDCGQESLRRIKLISFRRRRSTLTGAGGCTGAGKAIVLDFQEVDETSIDLLGDAILRQRHSYSHALSHQSATGWKIWPISKGSGWWYSAAPGSAKVPLYADYSVKASASDTGPPWRICTRENAFLAL